MFKTGFRLFHREQREGKIYFTFSYLCLFYQTKYENRLFFIKFQNIFSGQGQCHEICYLIFRKMGVNISWHCPFKNVDIRGPTKERKKCWKSWAGKLIKNCVRPTFNLGNFCLWNLQFYNLKMFKSNGK